MIGRTESRVEPLAREVVPPRVLPAPAPAPVETTAPNVLVVAIAPSAPDRLRLAASMGDRLSLLMVASVEEALTLIAGLPEAGSSRVQVVEPRIEREPGAVLAPRTLDRRGLAIDPDGRVLVCGDRTVDLTPLEHDVMECLLHEVGRTWPYEALHRRVWGSDHHRGRADVHSVVKRLRHKLTLIDSPVHLDVVRGVGLRLLAEREPGH